MGILAIIGALVAMSIRKKRAEEANRKADIKKDSEKAEGMIVLHMDEMDGGDMKDIEGTTARMKAERDRLKEENEKLAADLGEEPFPCAATEDPDVLVEQIKSLKGENDRLREAQQSRQNKRGRRQKKKAEGF